MNRSGNMESVFPPSVGDHSNALESLKDSKRLPILYNSETMGLALTAYNKYMNIDLADVVVLATPVTC